MDVSVILFGTLHISTYLYAHLLYYMLMSNLNIEPNKIMVQINFINNSAQHAAGKQQKKKRFIFSLRLQNSSSSSRVLKKATQTINNYNIEF
jgi:hypothetical protein